jgi:hypothetical protein
MSILSYNQINELFNQVAIAHYQIKRFGSGELSEADINKFISENQEYPVLWMTPVSVTTNSNVLLYSLNLLVFDLVNKDKDNEREVLSDCLQIALDVVRILRYGNAEFNIVTEPNISPFAGRYSDWVAGWSLEIELEVDIQSNNCDIPYEGLDLTQVLQSFVAEGEPGFQCIDLEGCELIINLQQDVATALNNTITGGTYNSGTTNLTLTTLDGSEIIITGITSGGGSNFNCDALANCDIITGLTGDVQTIFSSITGTPNEIAYYNVNGNLTGDTNFTRLDETNNFTTQINTVNFSNINEHQDAVYDYNRIRDRVFNDDVALLGETNLSPTGYFNIINNTTGNTFSGLDILENAGTFRYTDSGGTYNGFFYTDQQPGFSVERNGSQYNYFLPKSAYVAGGILTDPNGDGQLQWDLPQDTGTGGGGIPYYLNLSNSQTPYREFSPIATTAAEQSSGVSIANGVTATIAEFLTPVGYPNSNLLPGGVWTFHLHSYKQNNNASFNIFVEVYKRTSGGTETLLFTTDPAPVTTNSPTPSMQISDAYFSGTPLLVSDRLVAKVRATNTGNQTRTITLFTEGGQHYSYATTTFSPLGLTCATLSGCSVIQTIETNLNNKYDKSGGTISGDVIIQSGLTADTFNISTTPTLNNSPTQILSRNSSTGVIEYTEPSQYLNEASTDQIYGSGFDGDIVMDGTNTFAAFTTKVSATYTLTRSIYANNLTLTGATTILDPNGFGVFVKGTLILGISTSIRSNGNNGNNAVAGTRGTGATGRNAAASNYIIMNTGAAGGLGGNASSAGASITVGVNYVGGIGGSGGLAFPIGNSGVGITTARGVVTVTAGILQQPYSSNYLTHSLYYGSIQMFAAHSGAGGGCGINAGGAIQGAGGGGGSSPRGILIIANTLDMSAAAPTIQSKGGNGGEGGNASGVNGTGGGGGGAGGGGFIYIISNNLIYGGSGQITAAGGVGGLGGTGVGTVNTQNVAGVRSQSGSNGVDGYVVVINPVAGSNVTYTREL